VQEFKKIKIWQKAMEVTVDIDIRTADYPKAETNGLISQMRRASVCTVSAIAEGAEKNNPNEFIQFPRNSQAISTELETQLLVSSRLGLLNESEQDAKEAKIFEIQKMNRAFQESNQNTIYKKKSSAFIPEKITQGQTNRMTK
jgi:four helix bundle protein